jgi:hypothetical protein
MTARSRSSTAPAEFTERGTRISVLTARGGPLSTPIWRYNHEYLCWAGPGRVHLRLGGVASAPGPESAETFSVGDDGRGPGPAASGHATAVCGRGPRGDQRRARLNPEEVSSARVTGLPRLRCGADTVVSPGTARPDSWRPETKDQIAFGVLASSTNPTSAQQKSPRSGGTEPGRAVESSVQDRRYEE